MRILNLVSTGVILIAIFFLSTCLEKCFWLTAALIVYGREIFIYPDLTPLCMENIQFDIQAQDSGENYQIKKDRPSVSSSSRPRYAGFI